MKKLQNLGKGLSKEQQKKIKGGYVDSGGAAACKISSCSVYHQGVTYHGECAASGTTGETIVCWCKTQVSQQPVPLSSNGGVSKCYLVS